MPDNLFRFIERNLFEAKFYRKNLNVEYNFIEKIENRWLVSVVSSFDVHNLTDTKQKYSIEGTAEKPTGKKIPEKLEERLGLVSLFINNKKIPPQKVKAAQDSVDDTEDRYVYNHNISIEAGKHTNVKVTYMLLKFERDYECWRTMNSSDRLRVKISHPPNLEINMSAIHPKREFDYRHSQNNSIVVELNEPLTPQNGVLFWWG